MNALNCPHLTAFQKIGSHTASAVLATVYGRAEPLVDVNMKRPPGAVFRSAGRPGEPREPLTAGAFVSPRERCGQPARQLGGARFRGARVPCQAPALPGVSAAHRVPVFQAHDHPLMRYGREDCKCASTHKFEACAPWSMTYIRKKHSVSLIIYDYSATIGA